MNDETRSLTDVSVLHATMMMLLLNESDPGWLKDDDEITGYEDFKLYEDKYELHGTVYGENEEQMSELFEELKALPPEASSDASKDSLYIKLFEKYRYKELLASIVLNVMPLFIIAVNLEHLQNTINRYPPLVQLLIVAYSLALQQRSKEEFYFITNAPTVENVYLRNKQIHALHHKIFWVIKALNAMNNNDKKSIQHFHSLLSMTGIGGKLKHAYAIRLGEWLEKN